MFYDPASGSLTSRKLILSQLHAMNIFSKFALALYYKLWSAVAQVRVPVRCTRMTADGFKVKRCTTVTFPFISQNI